MWDTMQATINKNSDLEFDSLQPCFYPDEDDFYHGGPDAAPPGEDIWKKFELLPTPPLSPSRAALPGEVANTSGDSGLVGFGLGDPLDWASELMFLPESDVWGTSDGDLFGSALDSNPNSIIIHDCMWSGFSAREKLERVVTEKLGKAISSTPGGGAGVHKNLIVKAPELSRAESECVDPTVVFPFPVNKRPGVSSSSPAGCAPSSSRCSAEETPSDSEEEGDDDDDEDDDDQDDEDDEDDEEEEEEIDVVTVEKRRNGVSPMATGTVTISVRPKVGGSSGSSAVSRLASRAPQELILKRSSIHQQQHNYAAPSPYASDDDPAPPPKKHRGDGSRPSGRTNSSSSSSSCSSSSLSTGACGSVTMTTSSSRSKRSACGDSSPRGGGSDSEDSERRRNHNILERQRRNDLRSSFLTLRDHVPELEHNHKAAKVLILKKAAEYLLELETQGERLQQERDRLASRRHQLMRRLEQARTR